MQPAPSVALFHAHVLKGWLLAKSNLVRVGNRSSPAAATWFRRISVSEQIDASFTDHHTPPF